MGWLRFFSGKTAEAIEMAGDDFFGRESFGAAKIEYEKALEKHQKKPADDAGFEARLTVKLAAAREALASANTKTAAELFAADCPEDAAELLHVAADLTDNRVLKAEIESLLNNIAEGPPSVPGEDHSLTYEAPAQTASEDHSTGFIDTDEYFAALVNALPPEEKQAYPEYGPAFKKGFVALNLGDFEKASRYLSLALEENMPEQTYIPLELATCSLNTGELKKAEKLLESFLRDHPESERAYQVLCETLWGLKAFDRALERLESCPRTLADTMGIFLLKGETLYQAGKYEAAEAFYRGYIASVGREEPVLRPLAGTLEALGKAEEANALYAELMNGCRGCGRRPDIHLRQRFADTSLQTGNYSVQVLEIYLGLAQEDPANRAAYYEKVSAIYAALGNENEALRFRGFSEKEALKDT
jgi:tetratricopeptide (TPR) repeat protein